MGGWRTERIWTCAKHREGKRMKRTQLIAILYCSLSWKGVFAWSGTPKSSWDFITDAGLYSSSATASEGSSAFCIIAKAPVNKVYAAGQKIKTLKYNLHFGIWAFRTRLFCIFKHFPVTERSSQVLCCTGSSIQQLRLRMETSKSHGSHNRATGVVAVPCHDRESSDVIEISTEVTVEVFKGALLGAKCFGWADSYFGYWNRTSKLLRALLKIFCLHLAECSASCQEHELVNKLSLCQVKTQLSNHSIVATTSHLEMVLILYMRCIGSYGINVCKGIVRPALTCKTRRKITFCSPALWYHSDLKSLENEHVPYHCWAILSPKVKPICWNEFNSVDASLWAGLGENQVY